LDLTGEHATQNQLPNLGLVFDMDQSSYNPKRDNMVQLN